MRCLNVISFKRNGELFRVPCGKCVACLTNKAQEWEFRLKAELDAYKQKAIFVTLTYAEEHLPKDDNGKPILVKRHVQNWLRYLRRDGLEVRYFCTGEHGDIFQRPHYHLIMYGLVLSQEIYDKLLKRWKYGFITIKQVTPSRIAYLCKYVNKLSDVECETWHLMSKRPCIGHSYFEDRNIQNWHTRGLRDYTVYKGGIRVTLPRTIREKLFSRVQRESIKKLKLDYRDEKNRELLKSKDGRYKYYRSDFDELAYQQKVKQKILYKQQLKKEQYEYIQKLKTHEAENK